MPDRINILKILAIAAVGTASLLAAVKESENYAAQAAAKEKTLAEAVMQNQLQAELKKAEEQVRQELEEQGETLVTTVMETKPPVTEAAETTAETTVTTAATTAETVTETVSKTVTETSAASETSGRVTEFTRGGLLPEDRSGIPPRTMFTLTRDEQEQVMNFLIEHYFLDGFKYAEAETDPQLKEKKLLAAQMESSAIESLNLVLGGISGGDISSLLTADYGSIKADAEAIREDFKTEYANAAEYGELYAALYEDSLKYFDRLIEALGKMEETARQYNETANPLLALGLLTSSVNDVLLPEIMAVLEQSFDLVETSQEIFLEGTRGTKLLSRDEVRDIIENPALAMAAASVDS